MNTHKKELLRLLKKSLQKGNFILTSGKITRYYLDGRAVTLTPEGAYLSANLLLNIIKETKATAVGGPTLSADPIMGAIAYLCHIKKLPLKTFIIRKSKKKHGAKKQIEGPALSKKDKIILIDDTATTGKSLIESLAVLKNEGYDILKAVVLVNREEGAKETLAKVGLELVSIFTLSDLL